jgi:hypothetical protein
MKQFKIFTLILLVAFSSSCNKDSDSPSVVGDAIIVSKRSGTDVVYGVALYAYAYSSLKTVTVASSTNPSEAITLAANGSYTYNFYREPSDSEYSATIPTASIYTFSGVLESGATFECQDILASDALVPVTFEKCQYNTTNSYAELDWTALTNADSYAIYVISESGTIVFRSSELSNTVLSGTLSSSASGWVSGYPVTGATYTVKIYAFKYEDSSNINSYHLQATSISDATLTWGQ